MLRLLVIALLLANALLLGAQMLRPSEDGLSRQPASSPSYPAELAPLAAKMRSITTLQANVKQEKELAAFGDVMRAQGSLVFARPKKLVMDLSGAGGTTMILTGDQLVMHYKALGRTEIDNFNGHLIELAGDRACDLNRSACALVKRMTDDRLAPDPNRLDELAA